MAQRTDFPRWLALAGAALALAACGAPTPARTASTPASSGADTNTTGDIPDTQAYVTFTPTSGTYSLKVPEGWARTETNSGVSFSSHFNGLRVETQPAAQPPTVASATADELPALRGGTPGFSPRNVTMVHRSAGDAVLVRYHAQSQADPVTGRSVRLDVERYEFWRSGVKAIVTVSDPTGSDNADPWRTITDSFTWR
jgi:hypothetical protein